MGSAAEAAEQLKYQTWVLKVSIHCEGCKRKVKKVLQSIDGVYTTVVDMQQQQVTVTGNVDAELLLKKLVRTGKRAEVLPQPKKEAEKKEKQPKPNPPAPKEKNPKPTDEEQQQPNPPPEKNNNPAPTEDCDELRQPQASGPSTVAKKKEKKTQAPAPNPNPNADTNPNAPKIDTAVAGGGGGGGGGGGCGSAGAVLQNNLLHPIYHQFPAYHPQVPVYALSYNVTQPASAHGYYSAPPGAASHVFAGVRHVGSSYDVLFSEENASGCSVM